MKFLKMKKNEIKKKKEKKKEKKEKKEVDKGIHLVEGCLTVLVDSIHF